MPYSPDAQEWWPDLTVTRSGITDLQALYPVASADVTYRFQPGFVARMREPFQYLSDSDCKAITYHIRKMNLFWERMDREGSWIDGTRPDRLYGCVPQAASDDTVYGMSNPLWWSGGKGRVAAGLDACSPYVCGARGLAHEIGHNLDSTGLRHTDNPMYYPYPDGKMREWGVDTTSAPIILRDPAVTYDLMVPNAAFVPVWISPYNYVRLLQGFQPVAALAVSDGVADAEQHLLLASGIVYSPTLAATLDLLFDMTSTVAPDTSTGTDYCLELRDVTESVLDSRCFDLSFTNPETGEPTGADGFTFALPYPIGTRAMVLKHLGAEVTRVAASTHAPAVQVLSPNGGETWAATGTQTITWTASDTDGDSLHYAISLSTDGGVTWNPLVLDTTDTSLTVDASTLPGSSLARVRVQASDGFLTGSDASDATFTIASKGPEP